MLETNASSPVIHYALGNLYSRQKDWPAACRHYEQSVEMSPINPDYMFNLAVCLDQINQKEKALKIYKSSIKNAKNQDYNFNIEGVLRRISSLEKEAMVKP